MSRKIKCTCKTELKCRLIIIEEIALEFGLETEMLALGNDLDNWLNYVEGKEFQIIESLT